MTKKNRTKLQRNFEVEGGKKKQMTIKETPTARFPSDAQQQMKLVSKIKI